jgi:hypothetical protein
LLLREKFYQSACHAEPVEIRRNDLVKSPNRCM